MNNNLGSKNTGNQGNRFNPVLRGINMDTNQTLDLVILDINLHLPNEGEPWIQWKIQDFPLGGYRAVGGGGR